MTESEISIRRFYFSCPIQETAKANGCPNVKWISLLKARELEPNVRCVGAVLSESTGVIDSHGLMAALLVSSCADSLRANSSGVCHY